MVHIAMGSIEKAEGGEKCAKAYKGERSTTDEFS